MLNLSADIAGMLTELGEPVTLWDGRQVLGRSSVATAVDALDGDTVVAGRTRVLTFNTADVAGLIPGKTLCWSGPSWRVNKVELKGSGALTRAYIGSIS